ncbi:late competence development ComFB family protein [Leptothermofonsia sichuanensis E412]|uniref:late competence development ComFB family protein n=1 Tax=Leptothermofonsia sichuanensis TaxID=2917832 RepID=UPI001CA65C19|nr:late competence development ComFB family protein [Leptothermofonsia sichuanensis]QZZ22154.1 late competence development ComFB family protein [Leptothermofonsia sichuanensis E412]
MKWIVNLTVPTVLAEIEQILTTYPHHPHQQIFSSPDVRQELIAYVLTRIHSVYVAVDRGEAITDKVETLPPSTETRAHLESFIHQGIHEILQKHQDATEHQIPEENDGYLAASHWFG